jgi:hypothetical protein
MSVRRSRLRVGDLARRGLLAGVLLPGLLLLNLLCVCTHDAAAGAVEMARAEAAPCHAHDGVGAADSGGTDAPQPPHEGAACAHCGDGSALFASPRAVSDLASPDALVVPAAPTVLTMIALESAIPSLDRSLSPPLPVPRNRILRI